MKNSIRRHLSIALVLILILSATVLSGCYVTNSGKMSDIEGTYQLTHYSGDSDWLAERAITMFMVIRSDGTGYYAYKKGEEEPFIAELRCKYIQDPDDSSKYEYVEIDFVGNGEYNKFAINARSSNLNSQRAVWGGNLFEGNAAIDYYIDVDFKRVDKATDLSYIAKNFGNYTPIPFGAKRLEGSYNVMEIINADLSADPSVPTESPFVYFYLTIDVVNGSGQVRYMLKSDEKAQEKFFTVTLTSNGAGDYSIKFYTVNIERDTSLAPYAYYLLIPYQNSQGVYKIKLGYVGEISKEDIDVYIDNEYSAYLANKPITE